MNPYMPVNVPVFYRIQSGDTLSKIIANHYDIEYRHPHYKTLETLILQDNTEIQDPNTIIAGQLITLMAYHPEMVDALCTAPAGYQNTSAPLAIKVKPPTNRHSLQPIKPNFIHRFRKAMPTSKPDQEVFWALAWLQQNYDFLSIAVGSGLNTWGGLTSHAHNGFIQEVKAHYQQLKSGLITKGQYDYRRQMALNSYARKMGPFEKMLLQGQTARQAIRISRSKAIPATAKIDRHLTRLANMSKVAKYGGIVLSAAGVSMGCYNIAQEQDQPKKNEIFVETVGGVIGGTAASLVIGLIFVSNPVGWVVALTLGTSASFTSYASGKSAVYLYNQIGQRINLVQLTNLDQVCR